MKLFSITDSDDDYDPWGIAVWADSRDAALEFARTRYDRDADAELSVIHECEPAEGPRKPTTHEEARYTVLRRAGWREEDETSCSTCGLYAMGLDEFRVCDDCHQCRECGCHCEAES